jgi:hypothetical protein
MSLPLSEGPRAIAARAAPIDRTDTTLRRAAELMSAVARERDLRRACRSIGLSIHAPRDASTMATVAAIAAALDAESDDRARTAMADAALRSLVEALLDKSGVRGFLARVAERAILEALGHAPVEHFGSVAAHAEFRAELAAHIRACCASITATTPDEMFNQLDEALRT